MKKIFCAAACISWSVAAQCQEAPKADSAPPVVSRGAWSYDRSKIDWPAYLLKPGVKGFISSMEDQKINGTILGAQGWAEYDFEIPESGWHELMEKGGVSGWSRDIYLDGEMLSLLTFSHEEDASPAPNKNWYKEANLFLKKGKHTIRFRRLSFPGALPSQWELRRSDGQAAGCVRAVGVGHNVVRAGEKVRIVFSGGTTVPTSYELVVRDENSKEVTPCGKVDFDVSSEPVSKEVEVEFPRQGIFQLLAKIDGHLSRPADLKAGMFIVIDTKNPPPPAEELKTTPVVEIDCVQQTINGRSSREGQDLLREERRQSCRGGAIREIPRVVRRRNLGALGARRILIQDRTARRRAPLPATGRLSRRRPPQHGLLDKRQLGLPERRDADRRRRDWRPLSPEPQHENT